MKYKAYLFKQLESLPYFDKNIIIQLAERHPIPEATINTTISRALKRQELLPLKNGIYTTASFYEKNREDISYLYFLANILRKPSYISSWTALQYYDLCTESIYSITSVSRKLTRNYQTNIGNFSYHSIKKDLFSGFYLLKKTFDFFIATPSKALFDLLYFKTDQFRGVRVKDISKIIETLRIDIEDMEKKERNQFHLLIKNYYNPHG